MGQQGEKKLSNLSNMQLTHPRKLFLNIQRKRFYSHQMPMNQDIYKKLKDLFNEILIYEGGGVVEWGDGN